MKKTPLTAALIGSALCCSLVFASNPNGLDCRSVVSQENGVESYRGCSIQPPIGSPEDSARLFLSAEASRFGLDQAGVDLELVEVKNGLASQHMRFRQVFHGIPVFDSQISVHTGRLGRIRTVHRRIFDVNEESVDLDFQFSATEAVEIAIDFATRDEAAPGAERHEAKKELVWYPEADGSLDLAWQIMVFLDRPLGDFLTLVSATEGSVRSQENRIAFGQTTGSGLVYIPNPYQTQGHGGSMSDGNDATNVALDAERIDVTLLGLDDDTELLRGEYVDLVSLAGGLSVPDASEPDRDYDYDRGDDRFEQVVIYHSIDSIQRYFHSLGFDDDVGQPNGIRDFPTLANAHWYTADNSFYSTGDDAVHFGDGGVDDGEDADIIAHEYGHAVQHDQNASWGGGQMGAMGEAFGDYLAMSFYYSSGDGPYQAANNPCVGEWDATSYSGSNPPCLRRTDGTKHYPEDIVGQVHADGEIWSRALWDVRNAIGGSTTDQLVLEHHFSLPGGASMVTAAMEMLDVDVNLNGGANDAALRTAFCDRGFLSGLDCVIDTSEIFTDGFESGDTTAW